MALLAEWKSSLEMFRPKNLKLLSLVTLNAFKQAYRAIFYNLGWWLLALGILFVLDLVIMHLVTGVVSWWYQCSPIAALSHPFCNFVEGGFRHLEYHIAVFLFCVTIRPSVERKVGPYFMSFMKQFLYLLPLLWLYSATGEWIGSKLLEMYWASGGFSYALCVSMPMYVFLIGAMPTIFFALDSDGSFKRVMRAYWQGDKMIFYGLPAYLIVALFYAVIVWLLSRGIMSLPEGSFAFWAEHHLIQHILNWVLVPFFVCVMSVIYTKKVHDNSELYR